MKPELRRRPIGSIEYLRKMGFFQDHSSLSSEEMLKKIFYEETCYENAWWTGRDNGASGKVAWTVGAPN
jgi:hypothetical protein